MDIQPPGRAKTFRTGGAPRRVTVTRHGDEPPGWQADLADTGTRYAHYAHAPAGPRPVQLRFQTLHTGEQYVSAEGWREARLDRCEAIAL